MPFKGSYVYEETGEDIETEFDSRSRPGLIPPFSLFYFKSFVSKNSKIF